MPFVTRATVRSTGQSISGQVAITPPTKPMAKIAITRAVLTTIAMTQ